jgi:transcription initiation factor TFIID TATA-box-binding protein
MICVGAKSFKDAKHDLLYATIRLTRLGIVKKTRIAVKLQNIVAMGQIGKAIDIENLSTKLPNIIYEPEQFPGAIYHAKELQGASILIFGSGKVVIAGLRTERLLETARKVLARLGEVIIVEPK